MGALQALLHGPLQSNRQEWQLHQKGRQIRPYQEQTEVHHRTLLERPARRLQP